MISIQTRFLCARLGLIYFFIPSPGTTFITKLVGLSVGPNGPGTLFDTAGRLIR